MPVELGLMMKYPCGMLANLLSPLMLQLVKLITRQLVQLLVLLVTQLELLMYQLLLLIALLLQKLLDMQMGISTESVNGNTII